MTLLHLAPPVLAMSFSRFWLLFPLVAAISLVYTASRYEIPGVILRRATGFFVKTMIAMSLIFAVLYWLSAPL